MHPLLWVTGQRYPAISIGAMIPVRLPDDGEDKTGEIEQRSIARLSVEHSDDRISQQRWTQRETTVADPEGGLRVDRRRPFGGFLPCVDTSRLLCIGGARADRASKTNGRRK